MAAGMAAEAVSSTCRSLSIRTSRTYSPSPSSCVGAGEDREGKAVGEGVGEGEKIGPGEPDPLMQGQRECRPGHPVLLA